jgi:short-subunit dehydrogenase
MDSKVVVITGASGGIGAALARELGKNGHRLVLGARRLEALTQVAKESGDARAVACDVTRRADVERLRDEALRAFGHIDVWVNNAGRGVTRPVLELSDADVDEMMLVNVKSALYGVQAVVPHFQQRGQGHLINVSSNLGRVPIASPRSAYSAAKAALNVLTANLRMDLARTHPGVKVSLVLPGPVSTEFAQNALGGLLSLPPGVPSQTPEEVAHVIAGVISQPRAEVFTSPALEETARRYTHDVGAFEAAMFARR